MLAMAQIEYIKFLREVKGLSVNAIAKELKVNWRTVKKFTEKENWSEEINVRAKTYPVLGPYLDIIDMWLMEDQSKKQKYRHTNLKIYQRLRDECDFKGSVRTVTTYVANSKNELATTSDTYLDLNHPGGEAQVDFGTVDVTYNQQIIEVKYLVMSFPYSNAAFLKILPAENIECFLWGLRELFDLAGGVPKKIWFDNLSAAVAKIVNHQDRKLTVAFQRFKLHYGFQAEFCNPGKGNEKGNCENKVGTTRRNWMVPTPELLSFEKINEEMHRKAQEYLKEIHYEKKRPVEDLWLEEKPKMLPLPRENFEVFKLEAATLDNYGKVLFEKEHFHLPKGKRKERVLLKIYWDEVKVLNQNYELIGSFPRPYVMKEREIKWAEGLEVIYHKPKAATYAWIYSVLPAEIKSYLAVEDLTQRKKRIGYLLKWISEGYDIMQINLALEETSVHLHNQEGVMYHALYQLKHPELTLESLTEDYTPAAVRGYEPDLDVYNQLSNGGDLS